jgi:plastocyanin
MIGKSIFLMMIIISFAIFILVIPLFSFGQESKDICFDTSAPFKEITTTYDILIPFSSTDFIIFEPNEIAIPINTIVRWINLNNSTYNIDVLKENNTPDRINFNIGALGGTYSHNFSESGEYKYYNANNKYNFGKITVGDTIQKGKYITMTIGTNFPLKTTELKRVLISIEPKFETTNIKVPEDSPIRYNFTIANPVGINIYNKEIVDEDGHLYIELIPFPSNISISPNTNSSDIVLPEIVSQIKEVATQEDFVTWGFLDNPNTKNCLKGILRIMGPVLVDYVRDGIKVEKPYTINVSILSEGQNSLMDRSYTDTFILETK